MRRSTRPMRWFALALATPLVAGLTGCSLDFSLPESGGADATASPTESDAPADSLDGGDKPDDAGGPEGSGSVTDDDADPDDSGDSADSPADDSAEAPTDCGWGEPALPAEMPDELPEGQEGDLADALIGSWQHTHYDTGSGFESVTRDGIDIRFIFPSSTEMIYCQDVEGATDEASQNAPLTLDGDELVLPDPADGYRAIAWNHDTMLWENHFDGSTYLLQRR